MTFRTFAELGFDANCDGVPAFGLKAADFPLHDLPEGRAAGQYFVVCVPEAGDGSENSDNNALVGPVAPRLLGCPDQMVFDEDTKRCA